MNQEIDAGKILDPEETRQASEEGRAMQYLMSHLDLNDRRWELQILDANDIEVLDEHFSAYASTSVDYWPVRSNGLCHYIAWVTEMIGQNHWVAFIDLEDV